MIPVIIDIEASGFGRGSYPIELGVAFADGTTFCSLIHPEDDWVHWDEQAQKIHSIERKHLYNHGRTATELAHELNTRLDGETIYSDAWGVDAPWIALLFDRANTPQRFKIDTIRRLIDDNEAEQWSANKAIIIEKLKLTRHRASADARIIQNTFLYTTGLPLNFHEQHAAR